MMAPVAATPASPAPPSAFHSFMPPLPLEPPCPVTRQCPPSVVARWPPRTGVDEGGAGPRRGGRPDPHGRRLAVPRPLRRRPGHPRGDQRPRQPRGDGRGL